MQRAPNFFFVLQFASVHLILISARNVIGEPENRSTSGMNSFVTIRRRNTTYIRVSPENQGAVSKCNNAETGRGGRNLGRMHVERGPYNGVSPKAKSTLC